MSHTAEQLVRVLVAPITTEKSTSSGDRENSVAFWVQPSSTKGQIKAAVEMFFKGVEVERVRTLVNPRDFVRTGRRKKMKKAYVKLKSGHEINLADMASN
mgnify:CR=1 FL=1|tara:strand:- start:22693 stop:22992 length:300 start_codon:yes stop_codon:yes gene_type:complete